MTASSRSAGRGQIVRFREQLTGEVKPPQAVLVVERAPSDALWIDFCDESDVMLVWPEVFAAAVAAIDERN